MWSLDQCHSLAILRGLLDAVRPTKANGESNKIVLTTPIHHPVWEVIWFLVKPVQQQKTDTQTQSIFDNQMKSFSGFQGRYMCPLFYILPFLSLSQGMFSHPSLSPTWSPLNKVFGRGLSWQSSSREAFSSPVAKGLHPPASAFTPPFRWLTWTWNHLGSTPDTHCWKGIKCCFSSSSTFPCMISVMSITRREIKVIRDTNGSMPHWAVQKRMVSQTRSTRRRKEPGTKPQQLPKEPHPAGEKGHERLRLCTTKPAGHTFKTLQDSTESSWHWVPESLKPDFFFKSSVKATENTFF